MIGHRQYRYSSSWLYCNGLDKYRQVLIAQQISLFMIGTFFWVDSRAGNVAFSQETWGDLAYSAPAEMWALMNLTTASMITVGLLRPVKKWMVAIGSAVACAELLTLSYSAVFTGGAVVVGLYASLYFLPLHLWLFAESLKRAP